jgi:Ras-related protein Rab-20
VSNYYSRGAQAAILAYDITNRKSFEALRNYMDFLKEADKNCFIIVIGTKIDLVLSEQVSREVPEEEGRAFALGYNAAFYETSSKTGANVSAVFDTIGYHCLAERLASPVASPQETARASQTPSSGRERTSLFSCCSTQ